MDWLNELRDQFNKTVKNQKPKPERKWYNLTIQENGSTADLSIYDEIGYWGTMAEDFQRDIDKLSNKSIINISINSPGGDVFDGFAIYNLLKGLRGQKNVIVDGLAASIASVIAMVGDNITMHENTFMMIHNPWSFMMGDSEEMRKVAELLDKIKVEIVKTYQARSGNDAADFSALMDDDSWLSATEAVELGLADSVIENIEAQNIYTGNLAVPETVMNCLKKQPKKAISNKDNSQPSKGGIMDPIKKKNEAETPATDEQPTGATPEEVEAEKKEAADGATARVRGIINSISKTAQVLKFEDSAKVQEIIDQVLDGKTTEAAAKDLMIEAHAATLNPAPQKVQVSADEADKYRNACITSLCMSGGVPVAKEDKEDVRKNGFAGLTLQGLARDSLDRDGVTGVNRMNGNGLYDALCSRPRGSFSQGSDDFAAILENTLNKSLDRGFSTAPVTYPMWTQPKPVNDFRAANMISMSIFSDMEVVREGQGFTFGTFQDKKEQVTIVTYGKAMSLTREALVNDDLGAFTEIPMGMGASMQMKAENLCIDLLTSNSLAGPTMNEDSVSLFSVATHANLVTAGGAPSIATISAGRTAMQKQSALGPGDKKGNTQPTGVDPSILLVPSELQTTAQQVVMSISDSSKSNDITFNPFTGLQVISSPRLSAKSTTGWYLMADPTLWSTIVFANLAGNESPTARTKNSEAGEALGVTWDIYWDMAAAARDWRYAFQNDGTA